MKIKPRVFFDVEVGGLPIGRVVFELYSDVCPRTAENFRALCTGEMGIGLSTGKPLCYKGIVFHRVVKNFMIQGGDFSVGNGTGGESIYGGTFKDENFTYKHDKPYLLSMANRGKDTNGSQFFVTTQPSPHLDNIHVVFGEVISGQEVVSHVENLPVDRMSRPLQDAKVVNCGELVLKSKKEKKKREKRKSSVSESDSDSEKDKKKKTKKKKWTEAEDCKMPEPKKSKVEDLPHPLASTTKIDPDEIPEVPTNKFLYRGGSNNNANQRQYVQDRRQNFKKSPGGRIFKGRGVCRYRSLSRSRSRSLTPPHWKQAQKKIIKFPEYQKIQKHQQDPDSDTEKKEDEVVNLAVQNNGKLSEGNRKEAEKENTIKKDKHPRVISKVEKFNNSDDKRKTSSRLRRSRSNERNDKSKSDHRTFKYSSRPHKSPGRSSYRDSNRRYRSNKHSPRRSSSRSRKSPRRSRSRTRRSPHRSSSRNKKSPRRSTSRSKKSPHRSSPRSKKSPHRSSSRRSH